MTLSIIIPNYNGSNLLKSNFEFVIKAIDHWMNSSGKKGEIIIVDDASTDDSIEVIEELIKDYPKATISLFKNERNMGFSPTINKGVSNAKGEIVYLLNSDTRPYQSFISPLLDHFKDEKVFAVGSMDESIEKDKKVYRGRGIGKWERGFLSHRRGEVNKSNTLWVNGGSGAFNKNIWNKLRGLDEIYKPFYYEDIDISYRALKSGYKTVFENKSIIVHEHEKGAIKKEYKSDYVKEIAYRNQFIFVWKNADLALIMSHLLWLPYHLIHALERKDKQFFKGLLKAISLLPTVLKLRQKEKKLFKLSDSEIISQFNE